jgi:purine-binding chemotaxis protein CheW
MENQIVVFELGTEHFGVEIAREESIIKMQPITKLPHASNFITGIAKLDQRLVILLDLHRILTNEERLSLQPA